MMRRSASPPMSRSESGLGYDAACPIRHQRKGCRGWAGHVLLPSARVFCPTTVTLSSCANPGSSRALMQHFRRARARDRLPLAAPGAVFALGHSGPIVPRAVVQGHLSLKDPCRSTAHPLHWPPSPLRLLAERIRIIRMLSGCAPVLSPQLPFNQTQQRRAPRPGRMSPPATWPVPVVRPTGAQRTKTHGTEQDAY